MVIISQKNFNKNLDKYLKKESKKPSFSANKYKIRHQSVPKDLSDDEVYVEEKEGFFDRFFGKKQKPIVEDVVKMDNQGNRIQTIENDDDFVEMETVQSKKVANESFISKVSGFFSKKQEKPDHIDIAEIEANTSPVSRDKKAEDLKELAKIMYRLMETMSHEQLEDFKSSKDFIMYKEILSRNGLLKK